VTLNKNLNGGNTYRLLVHNEHVWIINNNLKEFNQSTKVKANIPSILPVDSMTAQASKWKRSLKRDINYQFVSSYQDLQDLQICNVLLCNNVEQLFIDLWENGYEGAKLKLDKGVIQSFMVRLDNNKVYQVNSSILPECTDNQPINSMMQALNCREQVIFDEYLFKMRNVFTPNEGLSIYSNSLKKAFDEYKRGARVTSLKYSFCSPSAQVAIEGVEIDITRAYTEFLTMIEDIPVFSIFDELLFERSTTIHPLSFYLIEAHKTDMILFNRTIDFVTGETLLYAQSKNIEFKILGQCKPHKIFNIGQTGKELIKSIYEDDELSDITKKNICNITYGLCNKSKNIKQYSNSFLSENEAKNAGGFVKKLGPGYINVKQSKSYLSEGYLPVGRIILDKMRIKLHSIVNTIPEYAISVRTDAVYIKKEDEDIATQKLLNAGFRFRSKSLKSSSFNNIGSLRKTNKSIPEIAYYRCEQYDDYPLVYPVESARCERVMLQHEDKLMSGDWSEYDALLNQNFLSVIATAIEGLVPGSGKTYSILSYCERNNLKMLFICPFNALCSDLVKKGFTAITLHELVGKMVPTSGAEINKKKPYDISDLTHIHFEEVYLYTVSQLGWIKQFMTLNSNLKFSMCGDFGQLLPINQNLSDTIDPDEYHEMIFASMFPVRLTLTTSKRVKDPEERKKMLKLCNELREEKRPVLDILKDFQCVDFKDLTKDDASYPHISALRQTMFKVDNFVHNHIGETKHNEYKIAQELLGVDGCRCKGGRIASNETYVVYEIKNDELVLTAPDKTRRTLTLAMANKYLKRPYCRTAHSSQGLTLGDKIYIHDYKSNMANHRWMRTAISRCRTLNIVLVNHFHTHTHASVIRRIEGHKQADHEKKFHYDEKDYVTKEWVIEKLKKQRYACAVCNESLDMDFSIDRKANNLPHIKSNCQMVCRRCNCASAHHI